ncbi:MAG TPA: hypothetical protein VGG23_10005 [Acidimicrobiales bacterium]|jgi:hypothetical protein
MIRLTWRQFRTEAVAGIAALVVVAVALAVTGPHLVDVYHSTPHQVLTTDPRLQAALAALVLIVPALVGVFFGAPLVARELETGTYRLAWTQSVTRVRWLAAKLVFVGLASSLLVGGLSLMVAWWANPINIVNADRFSPANFSVSGIVPFGYALFAFALGATTGILFRRTLPAMATTLVGYIAVRLVVTFDIRRHFAAPLVKAFAIDSTGGFGFSMSPGGSIQVSVPAPDLPNAWVLSTGVVDHASRAPTSAFLFKACPALGGPQSGHAITKGPPVASMQHCLGSIAARFHGVVTYQPASRYWPFQIDETALFVVLALALAGVSVWWVRRRLT